MNNKPVTEAELTFHEAATGARRVTEEDIKRSISQVSYRSAGAALYGESGYNHLLSQPHDPVLDNLALMTICVVVCKNGIVLVGQAACADPKMYDETIGRRLAYQDAIRPLWGMLGYQLKDKLARGAA